MAWTERGFPAWCLPVSVRTPPDHDAALGIVFVATIFVVAILSGGVLLATITGFVLAVVVLALL